MNLEKGYFSKLRIPTNYLFLSKFPATFPTRSPIFDLFNVFVVPVPTPQQVDSNKITATDYAVYIEGLPKTAGRKEIGQFFRYGKHHPKTHERHTRRAPSSWCWVAVEANPKTPFGSANLEDQERWVDRIIGFSSLCFLPPAL